MLRFSCVPSNGRLNQTDTLNGYSTELFFFLRFLFSSASSDVTARPRFAMPFEVGGLSPWALDLVLSSGSSTPDGFKKTLVNEVV